MSKGKTLETIYTAYHKHFRKSEHKSKLNQAQYLQFMNGFCESLMGSILDGNTVYLPGKLGVIQVVGKKKQIKVTEKGISGLAVDWIETKKLWSNCEECKEKQQKVYLFNEHSDGIGYRFAWSRIAVTLESKFLYTYVPNRESKRNLAKVIKEGKEYLILEGREYIHTKKKQHLKNRKI